MQYGNQSPQLGREPLLASAQNPGISQRLSDSSFASYEQQSSMSHRGLGPNSPSASYASFSSGNRFGPTAQLDTGAQSVQEGALPNGAYANGGIMEDDDDLDDNLHTFTAADKKDLTSPFDIMSWRGWANALTLAVLAGGGIMLFAGYPIISFYYGDDSSSGSSTSGYNIGGVNSSGQYPEIAGMPSLIDSDTPEYAYSRTGFDGNEWTLVFSDEFETDGRTFFEGDDPFWTAMDIHYWATGDLEWYDPSAITTEGGDLLLTMTQEPIHDLNFKSGMLQSWNKMCFNKNAYVEFTASLPGTSGLGGFWPGMWTMGNLGRPGYGASTEGMWPYTYDSCDVGIMENQTWANGTGPSSALTSGSSGGVLSALPGMRTPACTCEGEDHPGPNVNVGRSSPEIDIIEAQLIISEQRGEVSQSFQVAPFDDSYQWNNVSSNFKMYDSDLSYWNTYLGGTYQQAVSSLTRVPTDIYHNQVGTNSQYALFGMEYQAYPDEREKGYITWYSDNTTSWTMYADAVAENNKTQIGRRIIPEEPMALIINLAMSYNFQAVDLDHLTWPNYYRIGYVRVYQRSDKISIGCDPDDHPTADYIANHAAVYANANLTTWAEAGYEFPKNEYKDGC
ncbi:hypothetical protein B9479_003009 [Cryptococcus floricola]|uniref:GH16 domain-containing protein n=1 Tax=Cryptococcus floricola TaxID=2591691 RepID=A0A5D3AXW5_9TREE|nr:hypothetical protein B9479_003009 [Cryptococcus floricola]